MSVHIHHHFQNGTDFISMQLHFLLHSLYTGTGTSTSHVLLRRVFIHKLKKNNSIRIIMASVSTTTAAIFFYIHLYIFFRANQSRKKVVSVFTNPKLHFFIISFSLKT